MVTTILLAAALASQPRPSADDLQAYREAAAALGRDAGAHVAMALWCEGRGMAPERLKHLTRAVMIDPENTAARGLLGMVAHEGGWARPEDVRAALEDDPRSQALMQGYLARRAAAADTADAQHKLARWCDENGLDAQASAHYRAVVRLDPGRDAAWRKLGYKKVDGRWSLPEEVAAEKARAEARRLAARRWKPVLEKLRDRYLDKDPERRAKAAEALDAIADAGAVPTIWDVFVRNDARLQRRAAETFARIDGRAASLALAELAVMSPIADIRGLAIDLLARRDTRDYLDPLLDLIHKPFRYEVRPVGPGSREGGVFAEGERFNLARLYQLPPADDAPPARLFTDDVPLQAGPRAALLAQSVLNPSPSPAGPAAPPALGSLPSGAASFLTGLAAGARPTNFRPNPVLAEAIRRDQAIAALAEDEESRYRQAREAMQADVAWIERTNAGIRDVNDRVLPVVKAATGRDFGEDQDAWKVWWKDELGYAYQSSTPAKKPTYTEVVRIPSAFSEESHGACFTAGTPVHTLAGPAAIETLKVGDLVLSQDVETGAASYKPVLATHRNPPANTLRLTLGSETVTATGIHRFWSPGKGWTMARDLKPGDAVRALGGTRVVEAVEPGPTEPVYNLDVAENLDFFVGGAGFLVHDFSIVLEPARPFDAAPGATLRVADGR